MSLFRSKFAKLEALLGKSATDRTAEDLRAAQQEQDTLQTGLMLVPKTDAISTPEALQAHLDTLEAAAQAANPEALQQAQEQLATATQELTTARTGLLKAMGDAGLEVEEATTTEQLVSDLATTLKTWGDQPGAMHTGSQKENDKKPESHLSAEEEEALKALNVAK